MPDDTFEAGNPDSASALLARAYPELRRLAAHCFRGQPGDHTLQPTALVHEAFLKLLAGKDLQYEDRAHFLAVAATAMRQILISHARKRHAAKRGGGRQRISFEDDAVAGGSGPDLDLLTFDEAIESLGQLDARKARVVELRCFGGLTHAEIAEVLGVSKTTVEGDWRMARAWLSRALNAGGAG